MGFDTTELRELSETLKRQQSAWDSFCQDCAKELAARLLAKVIKRTPVGQYPSGSGKVGGTLRRGWTTTNEKQAMYTALFGGGEGGAGGRGNLSQVYGRGAVSEGARSYAMNQDISKNGSVYTIELTNPVQYASYVEFGHRKRGGKGWVEGKFFLTISEKELEADAPRILENRIRKKLGEYFA